MPRPTKLTPETINRLVEAVRLGATWEMAAAAAGADVSTVHRWRSGEGELNRELCDRLQKGEAEGALEALAAIRQAAQGGTWQAAAWLLERRYPGAYGRRTEVALSTPEANASAEVAEFLRALCHEPERVIPRVIPATAGDTPR